MNPPEISNLPASIHRRLLNQARKTGRPFNELLQLYAIERFLYRLSQSPHCDRFVLKGALMLRVWELGLARPTRDIDLLGHMANEPEKIAAVIREICVWDVEPDGIVFDPTTVVVEAIVQAPDKAGIRSRIAGSLGNARLAMQLDIGFDDVIVPHANLIEFPTLLDQPAPSLYGYSPESMIAEKFEAMVTLGAINSRMKDFYDLWFLFSRLEIDNVALTRAISATFNRRGVNVPENLSRFFDLLAEVPQMDVQWKAFLRRSQIEDAPDQFAQLLEELEPWLRRAV
ncbi:MAG: nucleotidyl transferase AbiEii/AbiGii toxin family protein [Anaerolineales bacterium]|nr:nucleotidyl transferase AbiEii/AbiGii toxin family protein [Anaerolineales bacterium]